MKQNYAWNTIQAEAGIEIQDKKIMMFMYVYDTVLLAED